MNFFLISFLIISIGGLATVVESKNFGWAKAAATNMIYPAYTMSITFCWTKIGDYYEDSVNELIYPEEGLWWNKLLLFQVKSVDEALYNFNWIDAPLEIKRMALIYKFKFVRPNVINGGAFYVSNLQLFGDVSL